jgi:hypothetical protein
LDVKKIAHLILPMVVILAGTARGQGLMEVVGNLGASSTANPLTDLTFTKTFAQQFTTGLLNPGDHNQDGNVMHQFLWELNPALGGFDPGYGTEGGQPLVETIYGWSLRTDNAGTPGGALFGTYQVSVYSPGVASLNYAALVSAGDYLMESNTTYWLTLKFGGVGAGDRLGQYANLPVTTSTATTGAGSLGALMENTGSGWTGLSERAVLQVQVESVPEPGTVGLVGLGLMALGILRRKKR